MSVQLGNRLDVVDDQTGVILFVVRAFVPDGIEVKAAAPFTVLTPREALALSQAVEAKARELMAWAKGDKEDEG